MRYVFFGTPRFAATVLEKLIDGGTPPSILVCNPDRPLGKKKIVTPPTTKKLVQEISDRRQPVKRAPETGDKRQVASDRWQEIKIFQPANKKELSELSDELFDDVDFGIVAAYAQIIPQEVIDKAKLGIIGVHPSLLPKLRGASPIQTAILEGHEKTGVNLFILDARVDNGAVIASDKIKVTSEIDYLALEEKLASLAGNMLMEILPKFILGKIEQIPQDASLATYTKKFVTEDGFVPNEDLEKAKNGVGAIEILRKIRALNPEPGVYTELNGKRTKLLDAEIAGGKLVLKKIQKEGGKPTLVPSS